MGRERIPFGQHQEVQERPTSLRPRAALAAAPSDQDVCPVYWFNLCDRLMREAFQISPSHPLFCNLQKGSRAGRPLSVNTPAGVLKRLVQAIGLDPSNYSSHSGRRGGSTAAVAEHVQLHVLKRHGNWSSDAVLEYVWDPIEQKASVSEAIARSALHPEAMRLAGVV